MSKLFTSAALAAALALGGASSMAFAQNAPATAPAKLSVENTTIELLLANAAAKAVIVKYLPDLPTTPFLPQIKDLSLRGLSAYPQANLNEEKLKAIQADLDKVG